MSTLSGDSRNPWEITVRPDDPNDPIIVPSDPNKPVVCNVMECAQMVVDTITIENLDVQAGDFTSKRMRDLQAETEPVITKKLRFEDGPFNSTIEQTAGNKLLVVCPGACDIRTSGDATKDVQFELDTNRPRWRVRDNTTTLDLLVDTTLGQATVKGPGTSDLVLTNANEAFLLGDDVTVTGSSKASIDSTTSVEVGKTAPLTSVGHNANIATNVIGGTLLNLRGTTAATLNAATVNVGTTATTLVEVGNATVPNSNVTGDTVTVTGTAVANVDGPRTIIGATATTEVDIGNATVTDTNVNGDTVTATGTTKAALEAPTVDVGKTATTAVQVGQVSTPATGVSGSDVSVTCNSTSGEITFIGDTIRNTCTNTIGFGGGVPDPLTINQLKVNFVRNQAGNDLTIGATSGDDFVVENTGGGIVQFRSLPIRVGTSANGELALMSISGYNLTQTLQTQNNNFPLPNDEISMTTLMRPFPTVGEIYSIERDYADHNGAFYSEQFATTLHHPSPFYRSFITGANNPGFYINNTHCGFQSRISANVETRMFASDGSSPVGMACHHPTGEIVLKYSPSLGHGLLESSQKVRVVSNAADAELISATGQALVQGDTVSVSTHGAGVAEVISVSGIARLKSLGASVEVTASTSAVVESLTADTTIRAANGNVITDTPKTIFRKGTQDLEVGVDDSGATSAFIRYKGSVNDSHINFYGPSGAINIQTEDILSLASLGTGVISTRGDVVPYQSDTYSLGAQAYPYRDLWLSGFIYGNAAATAHRVSVSSWASGYLLIENINGTNPARLRIKGDGGTTGGLFLHGRGGSSASTVGTDNAGQLVLAQNNANVMFVNTTAVYADNEQTLGTSGNLWGQIYSTNSVISTSDETEKEGIQDLDKGLAFIQKLKPKKYKLKKDKKEKKTVHYGFLAQDVGKVDKDFGGYHEEDAEVKDLTNVIGENDRGQPIYGKITKKFYGLRYDEFIAPLIRAVQELSAKVVELEDKLA